MTKINGPVNVIRLEGIVNNITKIVYLFMDIHFGNETNCNDESAVDIQEYMYQNFKTLNQTNKTYDFFLEIEPKDLSENITNEKKYINRVRTFFKKYHQLDKQSGVDNLSNVRFHYIDIRAYMFVLFDPIFYGYIDLFNQPSPTAESMQKIIKTMLNSLRFIDQNLVFIKNCLEHPEPVNNFVLKPLTDDQFFNILNNMIASASNPGKDNTFSADLQSLVNEPVQYLIYKMLRKYNNKDVEKFMNEYVDKIILPYLDNILMWTNKVIVACEEDLQADLKENEIKEIYDSFIMSLNFIFSKILLFNASVVDIFFLRRFLDKKYITNGIVYAGAYHISHMISVLVNIFDFKIRNASSAVSDDIGTINKAVQEYNPYQLDQKDALLLSTRGIESIFIPNDSSSIIQCSDVSDFPSNFM